MRTHSLATLFVFLATAASVTTGDSAVDAFTHAAEALSHVPGDLGEGADRSATVADFARTVEQLIKTEKVGGQGGQTLERLFARLQSQVSACSKTNKSNKRQKSGGSGQAIDGWLHRANWQQSSLSQMSSMASLHTIFYGVSGLITTLLCRAESMKLTEKQCEGTSYSGGQNQGPDKFHAQMNDPRYMCTSSWDKHKPLDYGRRRAREQRQDKELGSGRQESATKKRTSSSYLVVGALVEAIEDYTAESAKKGGPRIGEEDTATWGRRRRRGKAKATTRRRRWAALSKVGGWLKKKARKVRGWVKKKARKVGGWVKKATKGFKGFKNMLSKHAVKFLSKFVVRYMLKLTGWKRRTYNCMCAQYVKPYIKPGEILGVAPSFTKYQIKDWLTKPPKRKITFSVLLAPDKGHGKGAMNSGQYGVKSKLAICKFDVYVTLLECRKSKKYVSVCNTKLYPGTKIIREGLTCVQTGADEKAWGKGYQCKPNKASCEGGAIMKRDIGVQLDPAHPGSKRSRCKRFLLPLDSIVRQGIGPIAASNTEKYHQKWCARI